jgi:hypothetical protein
MMNVNITPSDLSVYRQEIKFTYGTQCPVSLEAKLTVLAVAFISVDENGYCCSLLGSFGPRSDNFRIGDPIFSYLPSVVASRIEAGGGEKLKKRS